MTTVEAVEHQIRHFTPSEHQKFRAWFASFDSDAWDEQIEEDAASGKLDMLAQEALAEYNTGKSREL